MDYRQQRRANRRNMRGRFGRISGIIWPLAIVLFFITHSWIWFPVAIFAPAILWGIFGAFNTNSQQQQQQPYYQPTYQPDQPVYQQPEQPVYQPYTQGYTPQQSANPQPEVYQESGLPHQYQEQEQYQHQQQYEDPMTMYPQE